MNWNPLPWLPALLVSCLLLPDLVLPIPVSAQESQCDPHLNAARGHPYEYRIRGDRCEGIYIEEVSNLSCSLQGFLEIEVTIEAGGDHKESHFQFKALRGDGMN